MQYSCEDHLSDKCTILVTQSLGRKIAWRARRTCAWRLCPSKSRSSSDGMKRWISLPSPVPFLFYPLYTPRFATPTFNWRSYGSKREVLVVHQTSWNETSFLLIGSWLLVGSQAGVTKLLILFYWTCVVFLHDNIHYTRTTEIVVILYLPQ